MPTLAFDGSVIYSTAVDRREIVYIAPSYTVEVLSTFQQTSLALGDSHTLDFANHPNGQATHFMLSLSEGDVDVAITNASGTITHANVTPSGMFILMNVTIDQVVITANADSVYDLIAGG
jgi:hypothetical protein